MLWGVTTFYNPARYQRPLDNFGKFSDRIRIQGLPLLAMELAFGDEPFQIDARQVDILVRLRTDTVLWHKERLLNIALDHLPDECDAVSWLDCDILFSNDDWVAETRRALDDYPVVQPFAFGIWLPPDTEYIDVEATSYPELGTENGRHHSFGFGWHHFGAPALEAQILHGHPGFAWAARRDLLDQVGLYDACIVGSNDALMAHAFVGNKVFLRRTRTRYPPCLVNHYRAWSDRAHELVRGGVSYVEGNVFHLWHGSPSGRQYVSRLDRLKGFDFDPETHIALDENGLYRWHEAPTGLENYLKEYFQARKEDDVPGLLTQFVFASGFYADEGSFRWAESRAELRCTRYVPTWKFALANNSLKPDERIQTISILRDEVPCDEVCLKDATPVAVELHDLRPGERLGFVSDLEFCPADSGSHDRRRLSFMLVHDDAEALQAS